MKCKLLFETKNVPIFEDFEKSIHQFEGCSIRMIIERACQIIPYSFIKGYLLTSADQCYKFEYHKETARILTEAIGELKPKVPLTFETLRKANIARLPEFKNLKGTPAHSKSDGSDWSPAQWLQAVIGELGEYANVMKKVERGDLTFEEAKPLIEKELADVMTYLDILAFRVGVDLSKAVEKKFNEVSERVGCSLRIENNEVVRKETEKSYCGTGQEKENSNRMEKYKSSAKQIANNWIGTNKISNTTRAKIEDLIEKDILDIKKSIDFESGKVSDIELITNAALMGVRFGDAAKLKVDQLIKNDLEQEEFNYETEIHKLVDKYEGCEFYPLEISHDLITDLFGLQFQEIDTLKQYVFAQAKTFNLPKSKFGYVKIKSVNQFYLFDFFSKQLGTKIVGMLINGHKENTKLNPGDLIQFYDDRNVLYNFRLVKSSDKNVEVSLS